MEGWKRSEKKFGGGGTRSGWRKEVPRLSLTLKKVHLVFIFENASNLVSVQLYRQFAYTGGHKNLISGACHLGVGEICLVWFLIGQDLK